MVHGYNCKLFIFFVSCKTVFPKSFCLKLRFFNSFTFEFNIFNDKIPETKHSHLSNGLQITSQTVQFFVSWKTSFPKNFSLKIVFFLFFLFEFNIFNKKIPKTKHPHLQNDLQLISQNVHFHSLQFCLIKILFPLRSSYKTVFVQLISNENNLFSICAKVQTQLK